MRRLPLLLAVLACAGSLAAFDAGQWSAKQEQMGAEAKRMKAAYAEYSVQVTTPAEEVTIPFETFEDGSVKAVVFAKRAQFFDKVGYVWASDLTVEQYKDGGELDFRMVADSCLIDRPHKCCWIAGHAKAQHRKTTIEGTDAFFCSSNSYLRVMSGAKVVSEDVKMKGLKL